MGVVVRRYIDILIIIINFPCSTCIRSFFWQQHPYFFVHFFNVFGLVSVIFLQYIANVTLRTFKIVQKNRDPANIKIIELYPYLRTSNVRRRRARASPETSTCEVRNQVRMTFD